MDPAFRLMTANLLHESCDATDFAAVLARVEPDVVVTQELGAICAELLGSIYPNHRLRPAEGFLGRGIATRLDATFGEIAMPVRPASVASLDVGGVDVRLAGMHLRNPIDFPWWVSARDRRGQLDRLFDWLDESGGGPVIVAGDFNASPRWRAYKSMSNRLADLVADHAVREGVAAERTWGWRPGWPRMLRIDHIFGARVRARSVTVEPIRGTDHAAVVADIEVLG